MLIQSISGTRFTNDEISRTLIHNLTTAFLKYLTISQNPQPNRIITVARDGRPSGSKIEDLICKTTEEMLWTTHRLGIVPTPTAQVFTQYHSTNNNKTYAGGIIITASHNPENWNGLKFLNPNGTFLNKNQFESMQKIINN